MEIADTLYVTNRADWRTWLADHCQTESEIWLIYYRKQTGKARIPYNSAVEEALCFGWIDSINKGLDDERLVQRFTPRKPKSGYSQTNIERLRKLVSEGRVIPDVRESLGDLLAQVFDYPEDIMAALRGNDEAWENFQRYSGSYQRIRIAYVETGRKRPGEFEKRLNNLIQKTAQNKQFGFGIEDCY
jgi:uncharacterized protein YdeI (YjbR/CyaY-like superfamily)